MKASAPNSVLVPNRLKNDYTPPTLPSKLYGSGKRGLDIVLDEKREAHAQENIVMSPSDFD
jgi:hypothetical protein